MKVPDSLTRERPHLAETCPEVEVAVLGPVEIRGITVGFSRASALELVVYPVSYTHLDVYKRQVVTDGAS